MSDPEHEQDGFWLRRELHTVVLLSATVFVVIFMAGAIWEWFSNPEIREIVLQHAKATLGIPLATVASFGLVLSFEIKNGPIKFKAIGFEFEGAAGPVVMWVLNHAGNSLVRRRGRTCLARRREVAALARDAKLSLRPTCAD